MFAKGLYDGRMKRYVAVKSNWAQIYRHKNCARIVDF